MLYRLRFSAEGTDGNPIRATLEESSIIAWEMWNTLVSPTLFPRSIAKTSMFGVPGKDVFEVSVPSTSDATHLPKLDNNLASARGLSKVIWKVGEIWSLSCLTTAPVNERREINVSVVWL